MSLFVHICKTIDKDVKYILQFIAHKIYYVRRSVYLAKDVFCSLMVWLW